jgi:ribosomal protein S18 acetylase RimI-like enzyme
MDSSSVRRANAADSPRIIPVLARAFADDPSIDWSLRADERRAEAVELFFDVVLHRMTLPFNEVWTTTGVEGAALWTPPGKWKLGLAEQVLMAPQMLRAFGWSRLGRALDSMSMVQQHHPREPHFYLQSIGVAPERQGQGLGKALMQPVLERCDRERVPAFLETAQERNLPLYRSRGFQELSRARLSGGGPMMYFMWREPGAKGPRSEGR